MRYKLGDICDRVCSGGTPSKKHEEYYQGGGIPWLNTAEVSFNRVRETCNYITELGLKFSSAKWIPVNSIIVAMYGATAGKVAINTIPLTTNQACCNLSINKALADYRYVYYFLLSQYKRLSSLANGGAQQNLNAGIIKDFVIDLPELPVQQKVADLLWTLDDKIELNNRINDNLERQGKSCIDDLCRNSDASIPISQLMNFINGFAFKSSSYLSDGKYRIITIKNVKDGFVDTQIASCINDLPQKMNQKCILNVGDILVSLTGNVGRVGIVCEENLLLNQRVAKIQAHDVRLNSLLYFYLRHPETKAKLENLARGTAQPNLSTSEALKIEIAFTPSVPNTISDVVDQLFRQIIQRTRENMILSSLRDSLLPKLMSGEIDVSQVWG